MTTGSLGKRLRIGLWHENPGLVQLLGLCPLLAVTTSFVNGLGLGLATLAVLVLSNGLVSATRRWLREEIRIPIYVLIIASLVTCIELVFKAWFPVLDRSLGIFTVPAAFEPFSDLERMNYRVIRWKPVWPKDMVHHMLVISTGDLPDVPTPTTYTRMPRAAASAARAAPWPSRSSPSVRRQIASLAPVRPSSTA